MEKNHNDIIKSFSCIFCLFKVVKVYLGSEDHRIGAEITSKNSRSLGKKKKVKKTTA